jgi:hypothetical protein
LHVRVLLLQDQSCKSTWTLELSFPSFEQSFF